MKSILYFSLASVLLAVSCTSSEDSVRELASQEPEIILFEEVVKPDSVKKENPKPAVTSQSEKTELDSTKAIKPIEKFYIQLGAFNSIEGAKTFIEENQSKIAYLMNITHRESDKKYLVRLKPFSFRDEAELVKNSIRQIVVFKDAFITPGEKR